MHFVRLELNDTQSLGTLFRGSSVASKCLSAFVNVVAGHVLKPTLANALGEVRGGFSFLFSLLVLTSFSSPSIKKLVVAESERQIDKESAARNSNTGSSGAEEEAAEEEVSFEFVAQQVRGLGFVCCSVCAELGKGRVSTFSLPFSTEPSSCPPPLGAAALCWPARWPSAFPKKSRFWAPKDCFSCFN